MFEILPRSQKTSVLMAISDISCGEPQEICTELEKVDLNEFITGGESGVYFIRASGDSMETEIYRGDWMVVNRNLQPESGDSVVVRLNGEYMAKTYKPTRKGLKLVPKNKKYDAQTVTRQDDFEIFGVVTDVFQRRKKNLNRMFHR